MTDEGEAATARPTPICPICRGEDFSREKGKIDSQWGMTAHRVNMLVCTRCGNILLFYEGNTIFDFD